MIFALERVSNPDIEPVSLEEMKLHLREYDSMTEMDDTISSLITAAREWVEQFTGRALVDQTWRLTIERDGTLPADTVSNAAVCGQWKMARENEISLRKSPVLTVESVISVDTAGAETTIEAETYALRLADSKYPKVVALNGAKWTQQYLQITFRAGYADRAASPIQDATAVPARYKQAIKLWVQANYNPNVDEIDALMRAAENLIKGERVELSLA
ncbi:phage head-tail connector protein [Pseudoduganella sp. UC29_106]|uniref:head-tail connector protein n=1 Tax=Pseudoduganella sp. UC29_106 TaxID=3374553 RepID=UPI0037582F37